MTKVFKANIHEEATARDGLGMKIKKNGKGKPIYESKKEFNLFKKTGKVSKIERIIDREDNNYYEKITDPESGEVIHLCTEALSKHVGHGDDKKNKKTKIRNA